MMCIVYKLYIRQKDIYFLLFSLPSHRLLLLLTVSLIITVNTPWFHIIDFNLVVRLTYLFVCVCLLLQLLSLLMSFFPFPLGDVNITVS